MKFDEFLNKTIFVTGAASGIGKAQVECFLANGAYVIGLDLQEATIEHEFYTHYIGSVTDKELMRNIADEYTIDILCNTAGILDNYTKSLDIDEALWDQIFNVNIKGIYIVTNAVLPQMLARKKGIIINMASIAGQISGGGGAAYTASKHAVIGYTKQLSYDYCTEGIRVNALAPGAIQTPMNAADFEGAGDMAKWVENNTPARRWAMPEEVANITLFLASSMADYMHATVIPIDGGWMNR